ncbi:hypothetical protein ACYCVF_36560 [Bradyrhizobium sp. 1.29L]
MAKRAVVAHLQAIMSLSERRACSIVGADWKMIRYRCSPLWARLCVAGCTISPTGAKPVIPNRNNRKRPFSFNKRLRAALAHRMRLQQTEGLQAHCNPL